MEVQSMSTAENATNDNADVVRTLSITGLRAHNLHVSGGQDRRRGCRYCSEGLAAALKVIEVPASRDGVVPGDRTDQERDPPPARADDAYVDWAKR